MRAIMIHGLKFFVFLSVMSCLLLLPLKARTVQAAENFSFSTTQPRVGTELTVGGDFDGKNVRYHWYRDEELLENSGPSYLLSKEDYEHWIRVEIVDGGGSDIGSEKLYFSKLPVVYINTEIGGVVSKESYIGANMSIQGNEKYRAQYEGKIQIKGRGNATWNWPKKPFKIKLDKKTDLFGFGKNKHYVLLANYLDESLMRNKIAYDMSAELGLIYMKSEWVDVVLNGEYFGNYLLCEQIRVGESRVNIFDWKEEFESIAKAVYQGEKASGMTKEDRDAIEELLEQDLSWVSTGTFSYNGRGYRISDYYDYNKDITGGYLFELDYTNDEISTFTIGSRLVVMLQTPEYLKTNSEMFDYVKGYWQDFYDAIHAEDGYTASGKSYLELADLDSMAGYWLVMEIMGNKDASSRSRFAYKNQGEKMKFGPVWDFDWSSGSATVGSDATGWKATGDDFDWDFFKELTDDPYFLEKAREIYWKIRDNLIDIIAEDGLLDLYYEYLNESGTANEKKWFFNRGFNGENGDVAMFKKYMTERIAWLDEQFSSVDTLIHSLNDNGKSAYPYVRCTDGLKISLGGVWDDIRGDGNQADGMTVGNSSVDVSVAVSDDVTKKLAVYVNGLKFGVYEVADHSCTFTVPAGELTETDGDKNVISLLGYDSSGKSTVKNFCSVVNAQISGVPYRVGEDGFAHYDVSVPHVIIRQVYGAGRSDKNGVRRGIFSHDFVELYNPAGDAVDLTGWSLQYCSSAAGNQPDSWRMIPLSGKIPAHSSFLIRGAGIDAPVDEAESGADSGGNRELLVVGGDLDVPDWEIYNRGISVVLTASHGTIETDATVFDNEGGTPVTGSCSHFFEAGSSGPRILSYVDMYAVSGTGAPEDEGAPAAEGSAPAVQTKSTVICRTGSADTDDNGVRSGEESGTGDFETVDYRFAGEKYRAYFAPHTSEDGAWEGTEHPVYTVTFDGRGGSGTDPIKREYGMVFPAPENPVRTGYAFTGWYLNSDCTERYDFSVKPVSDVTLYAGWEVCEYTIRFRSNGGTAVEKITAAYGTPLTAPPVPEKSGYRFTGWYTDAALSARFDFSARQNRTMPAENLTLYAGWEVPSMTDTWTAVFQDADGRELAREELAGFEEVTERDGFVLVGWRTDKSECGTDYTVIYREKSGSSAGADTTSGTNAVSGTAAASGQASSAAKKKKTLKAGQIIRVSGAKYKAVSRGKKKSLVLTYLRPVSRKKKITIPARVSYGGKSYKVTAVAAKAFYGDKKLCRITVGKNVEKIGKKAFAGCRNLEKVTIKSTKLKKMGAKAFYKAGSATKKKKAVIVRPSSGPAVKK